MKKCPVCESSKYSEGLDGYRCRECGYKNKPRSRWIKRTTENWHLSFK